VGKYMVDADMPITAEHSPLHFTDGTSRLDTGSGR